ncbi:hypothetical protein [Agromyces archimandritae]|uniref:Uncharacterized protein n=1 Tax=Agromyces archimandritae TaxID=2781962 RepID=A0A975IN94_9MICO|nr:hypothetical protein [Agromyces archimandritae]QTX04373.1 hypothetical protein G127AT_14035 [Agromyces archimandritae]
MNRIAAWAGRQKSNLALAAMALRTWDPRQIFVAILAGVGTAVLIGVATVLIPNPLFAREIAPVWWNYPVWILTSAMTGILMAGYVRPRIPDGAATRAADDPVAGAGGDDAEEHRSGRFAIAGGMLAWFAVGCPVCNKIALLALGYTGALTWFAPLQPVLAITAMVLSTVAAVWRLKGQLACPLPVARDAATA